MRMSSCLEQPHRSQDIRHETSEDTHKNDNIDHIMGQGVVSMSSEGRLGPDHPQDRNDNEWASTEQNSARISIDHARYTTKHSLVGVTYRAKADNNHPSYARVMDEQFDRSKLPRNSRGEEYNRNTKYQWYECANPSNIIDCTR